MGIAIRKKIDIKMKRSTGCSADVVNYLHRQGMTLKEIGKLIGASESFVCRIAKGQRNLIVDDLEILAKRLKLTLPELLIAATPLSAVPKRLKPTYQSLMRVLKSIDHAKYSMLSSIDEMELAKAH